MKSSVSDAKAPRLAQLTRSFVGIGKVGDPPVLVARFVVPGMERRYYMTLAELCAWIEHQMNSGFYYTARAAMAEDKAGLMALIEVQRQALSGKFSEANAVPIDTQEDCFDTFVAAIPAAAQTMSAN
ncbi:MAG: hypothetical protein KBA75_01930 [Alphaproteobacteria bacterium]|nr:hypothetical protein [Alphaproteobacteria bacterium]